MSRMYWLVQFEPSERERPTHQARQPDVEEHPVEGHKHRSVLVPKLEALQREREQQRIHLHLW
jgi:hypothetical protein